MRGTRTTEPAAPDAAGDRRRRNLDNALVAELPDLMHYALALTRDRTEAEDLVQDCILRALRRRHLYQSGTHARRWLFTILRHLHIDHCRRPRNRRPHLQLGSTLDRLTQAPSQDDWMRLVEVRRALGLLRRQEREVLVLCTFSRLDQRQIAARLRLAEGTVRSRLSRARTALLTASAGDRAA